MSRPSALTLTATAWGLGLVTTALILGTPYLLFGYHNPSLHLVLDSVDACIALLVAYLLYGRFPAAGRLQDRCSPRDWCCSRWRASWGSALSLLGRRRQRPRTLDAWLPL